MATYLGVQAAGVAILLIFCQVAQVACWENEELELFDLVEEINQNFYEVLGVDQSAKSQEIRKAYRQKSLQIHPDKNKDEDAEEKFRQLVAIYEVLKDDNRRQQYNAVLVNGLPDWRQPVYYYRRVRKMGLLELGILLLLILTGGHFLVIWAIYFEKRFEIEEVFRSKPGREREKRGRKGKIQAAREAEMEEIIQEELETIPRPRFLDLLPFKLGRGIYLAVVALPMWIMHTREKWREEREELLRLEEERQEELRLIEQAKEEAEAQKRARKQRRAERAEAGPEHQEAVLPRQAPVVYTALDSDPAAPPQQLQKKKAGAPWTDEELVMLAKAVAKYPGGSMNRWEKIGDLLGRSPKEVISQAKTLKSDYNKSVEAAAQGITGSIDEALALKKGQSIQDVPTTADRLPTAEIADDEQNADYEGAFKVSSAAGMAAKQRRHRPRAAAPPMTSQVSHAAQNGSSPSGDSIPASELTKSRPSKDGGESESRNLIRRVPSARLESVAPPKDSASRQCAACGEVKAAGESCGCRPSPAAEDGAVWTQPEQKILEWALANYPKSTPERWEKIAQHISGKTKEDCVARFKHLADVVKKRKEQKLL